MTETPPPPVAADGSDPSMEDILASIRRILNEDESPGGANQAEHDVLVLDRSMMVAAPQAAAVPAVEPAPTAAPPAPMEPDAAVEPVAAMDPEADFETARPVMEATTPIPPETPVVSPDLVAPEAAAMAASSVGSLVRTLAAGRTTQVYANGPTLEDLVRAELRPMLKEWLDANLPAIVERHVRTEIERVVGRAVP